MSGFNYKFEFLVLRPSYSKTHILVPSSSPAFELEYSSIVSHIIGSIVEPKSSKFELSPNLSILLGSNFEHESITTIMVPQLSSVLHE